jgi:hypothetical protein
LAEVRVSHFHLLWDVPIYWWHAWGAVVHPLCTDLGIIGLAFVGCTIVVRYIEHRCKKKSHSEAVKESWDYFHDNIMTPVLAYLGLFFLLGFALGPYEIHEQDAAKIADRNSLVKQVNDLQGQLQLARNNLDVSTPAANHLMYLLQAFRGYRAMLGGFNPISCQVRITAPPDSGQIVSTIAQFSIQVTNCNTFGPMITSSDPDEEKDTVTGMIPGVVVFHARRNDKAAFQLYDNLSTLLPLKRSYEVPVGSPQNFIWLQFGSHITWNGERP